MSPVTFSEWLSDQSAAIARLATIVPTENINLPFPGTQTKFSLLNGWRLPTNPTDARTAYLRARWFLTRKHAHKLTFSLRSPKDAAFTILINNEAAIQLHASTEWTQVALDLSVLDGTAPFVIEIRRDEEEADFEKCCFEVRDRKLHRSLFWRIAHVLGNNKAYVHRPTKVFNAFQHSHPVLTKKVAKDETEF